MSDEQQAADTQDEGLIVTDELPQEPVTTPPSESGEPEWIAPISEGHPILDAQIRSNKIRLDRLTAQGVGINVDRLMIQALIEDLYVDRADRQRFELEFQNKLANVLAQVEAQLDRAKLQAGTPGGLVVPGS